MESREQYQFVRRHPGMFGLHDDCFKRIFDQCVLDFLHEYSFPSLKIATVPERNEIIFAALERKSCRAAKECEAFLLIGGISTFAKFSAEYQDGSFRRTTIRETEPDKEHAAFFQNADWERLECSFILPEEFPIDENYIRGKLHQYSKIFPHCRIIYHEHEYRGGDTKNKITWFLKLGHPLDAAHFCEFSGGSENFSWEVSFTFDRSEKKTFSFLNGIATRRGGTHMDRVREAIMQAFRQTKGPQDITPDNMSLAVSIHLPPESTVLFDGCRWGAELKAVSEHPEFQLVSKDLKSQMIRYFSEHRNP